MKKKIKFILTFQLLFIISATITFSQTEEMKFDSVLTYYPIHIGNKWVFDEDYSSTIPPYETIHRVWSQEFVKDTLMANNESYSALQKIYYDGTPSGGHIYERIDTVEQKVYRYDPVVDSTNYEILFLDLTIELFDTFYNPYCIARFQETGTTTQFGETYDYRVYCFTCGLTYYDYYYLKGLGLYRFLASADFVASVSHLRGCIINGVVYGDTTVVSVEDETQNVPTEFSLSQNYPNPFNPSTTIKFSVPQQTNVVLKVYDILGSEVANLVNETLYAGNYTINFNASQFASGMYIYKITAGNFVTTKKMILLK